MTPASRVVVIVAFGRADLIARSLDALEPREQVLIIDNASDAAVAALARTHAAGYVDAGHNRGFAGGVNLALERLEPGAADVLLLNPDAVIGSADIDALQAALRADPGLAAVSPMLVGPDGVAQRVGWPFPSPRRAWAEALGLSGMRRLSRLRPPRAEFVVGAVLLLRREAIAAVGPFDERFFLYAEETDWQRRAAEQGWRSAVVESVTAAHLGAATSPDAVVRDARFHAAQEVYVRRWFGAGGWTRYRLAAVLGALVRCAVLPDERRRPARERARLYLRGPRRVAHLPPVGRPLRITHVVCTANLAGTEQHVIVLARAQAAAGHDVTVVGGDPHRMPQQLGAGVRWRAGATLAGAGRAIRADGPRDVVHTHLTAADLLGALTGTWHGARVISTRHIAARRGSSGPARLAAAVLQRRIDDEICISDFVRSVTGRPATIVRHGVADDERIPDPTSRRIVIAARLEAEKGVEVALTAWRHSGLAAAGWTLAVAGDGSLREQLRSIAAGPDVRWLGWVPDLRRELLDAAALLAIPPAEPFGLAVVEAMSLGLPVIAAAGGGHLETVGAAAAPILFAPDDVADCARALRAFAELDDPSRRAYGERLRALQRRRFTLKHETRAVEAVYRHDHVERRARAEPARVDVVA